MKNFVLWKVRLESKKWEGEACRLTSVLSLEGIISKHVTILKYLCSFLGLLGGETIGEYGISFRQSIEALQ